jgi:hypothetical protein
MALSWKDGVTTVLAAGTVALAYAKYYGWHSWLTAPRLGIVALALIGLGMCTQSTPTPDTHIWTGLLSTLGALSLVLVIIGLIFGQSWAFYALAGDILVLWLLSTIKHALGSVS